MLQLDLTEAFRQGSTAELEVADNGTLVVRVTDPDGEYHEEQAKINCFDRQAPTVTAGIDGEPLHIEATDDLSGVAGIQVNGLLFLTGLFSKTAALTCSLTKPCAAMRSWPYAPMTLLGISPRR